MFLSDWRGGGNKNRKKLSDAFKRNGKRSPFERRRLSLESLEQRYLLTGATSAPSAGTHPLAFNIPSAQETVAAYRQPTSR